MVLRIRCKSFMEYLGTLVAASEVLMTGDFVFEGPTGALDNLSPDLADEKESKEVTEGVVKGATEGRFRQGCPQPWTDVILELISFKNTLPNGLADPLDIKKLEL